jgi:hypothetical protein
MCACQHYEIDNGMGSSSVDVDDKSGHIIVPTIYPGDFVLWPTRRCECISQWGNFRRSYWELGLLGG